MYNYLSSKLACLEFLKSNKQLLRNQQIRPALLTAAFELSFEVENQLSKLIAQQL